MPFLPIARAGARALALGLAGASAVRADVTNAPVRSLALADCFRAALEHNLDVKIARFGPEIQQHNLSGSYGAYEPSLGLAASRNYSASPGGLDAQNRSYSGTTTYADNFAPGVNGLGPMGLNYNLGGLMNGSSGSSPGGPFENANGNASVQMRQPVLRNFWIDNARLTIEVNKTSLKVSELALRLQIMSTLTSVELAYDNLILAAEQVKVQREAASLAERLVRESKLKVKAGFLAAFDEKQAESQFSASQADLLSAQGALVSQEYTIKSLLSDSFSEWTGVRIVPTERLAVVSADLDLKERWRRGLTKRPDLLQAKLGIERQGVTLKYLRNQIYPELDLVGGYGQAGSALTYSGALEGIQAATSPSWSFGAQLTIPLAGNRAARENYRANKAQQNQMLVQLKQLEQNIMVQIGVSIEQAKTSYAQVDATRQSRVFAEAALDAQQKLLDNGKSTSFIVVQLQKDLTAARLAELTAIAQYNEALCQLAFNDGTTLERDKLDLRVK
jgi:outer membrane protein TolC